LGLFP